MIQNIYSNHKKLYIKNLYIKPQKIFMGVGYKKLTENIIIYLIKKLKDKVEGKKENHEAYVFN